MDPLSNYSSINPTYLNFPLSSAQAQQLLQHIGWTYYTIWEKDTMISPLCSAPRLAWRTGDVNRSLLADQINLYKPISDELITCGNHLDRQQINKDCKMGDILQQFYKDCGFLPWGSGIAGMALANERYRWASGEELFEQISLLAVAYKRQLVPLDLQGIFFKTVVCIPLQNGAGVLELGTKALKDKVGTLERSIEYLKELKDRVRELEHVKDALIYMNSEDQKDVVRNSSQHTSSHAIARCSYLPPSIVKDGNYFQLNVKKITKHEEVNTTNIAVLRALLKKKLHCMKFKSEFQKSNGKFDIDILAKYKDGENHTLSLDVIQEIEEWWPKAMKDL